MSKVQETSSILRVVFAISKSPHLHRAYLVTVCNQSFIAVYKTPKSRAHRQNSSLVLLKYIMMPYYIYQNPNDAPDLET